MQCGYPQWFFAVRCDWVFPAIVFHSADTVLTPAGKSKGDAMKGVELTDKFLAGFEVPAGKSREIVWDTKVAGFGVLVMRDGHRSFLVQYRVGRRSRRMHLGAIAKVKDARNQAMGVLGKVRAGKALGEVVDPVEDRRRERSKDGTTLKAIAADYLAQKKGLRTIAQRKDDFERLIVPKLGNRQIDDIRRSDITRLLDDIAKNNGPVMADRILGVLRNLFNWHAARSDDYRSPIVRGMARTKAHERKRHRILTPEEIQAIWKAAEDTPGPFGVYVRFTFLMACRRTESAQLHRRELVIVTPERGKPYVRWTLPAARAKPKVDIVLPLSGPAAALLDSLPNAGGYLFTTDGKRPIAGWNVWKRQLDKASGVTGWRLHDLRRTARTLLSQAGVLPDHAERCLGHVIGGVRGVYDRFQYEAEKRDGFERLAALIGRMVDPQSNVVGFPVAS